VASAAVIKNCRRGKQGIAPTMKLQLAHSAAHRHAWHTAPCHDASASRVKHGSLAIIPQLQSNSTSGGSHRQRNHHQHLVVSVCHCSKAAKTEPRHCYSHTTVVSAATAAQSLLFAWLCDAYKEQVMSQTYEMGR
jgi:hypothetical protein